MTIDSPWTYRPGNGHIGGQVLTGSTVEATDGIVGQVDRQADGSGMRQLIVGAGAWVFGRSVLVPAGAVATIGTAARQITRACSRDEVKAAPRVRTDRETLDPDHLAAVGAYYRALPGGRAE